MTGFHGFFRAPCSAATLWAWRAWVWRAWAWAVPCSRRPRRRRVACWRSRARPILRVSTRRWVAPAPTMPSCGRCTTRWSNGTTPHSSPSPAWPNGSFRTRRPCCCASSRASRFMTARRATPRPCDAEAVRWNIERNRGDAASNLKADLSSIEASAVVSPTQVKLMLDQPDAALPAVFSDRAGMMVSPTAQKAAGKAFGRNPVGAGPWRFVSWADNQKVIVTRHAQYWRTGLPPLDGIEFSIIPELATGLRSVVSRQNDLAYQLSARYRPIITREKALRLVTGPTLYCIQLYMNYARAPLDNPKLRQAINFALNREAFVKATMDGVGEPAHMNLPSTHWAYDKSVAGLYPHDVAKARQLMADAGLAAGIDLTIGGYTDQDAVRRGEIVMDQLGKIGIRLKFTNGTIPEISGQFFGTEKKFDMLLSAWTGRPDPSMSYSLMYAKGAYYNAGRSEFSPELSALLQESRAREDIQWRKSVFAKIQRMVMENALVAPLAFQFEIDALSNAVQGFVPNLLGKPKFNNLSLSG